ncbi:SDR family oxidoreductase, partial [Vibrio fluvialis]|nr:SDR family oxidoreductase [Vibrio fluvialis]
GASKSALHMLVKCMGIELAPFGVRCNIVSPGSTRTEMQMQLWNEHYGEANAIAGDAGSYRLGIPLQKIAEP